ncbi:MAG: response regulator [Pseudomonadales bacterium]|nr:response regulator [Pseudomonadales bacterium]
MNKTILVLDDDEHVLHLILRQLETAGIQAIGFRIPEPVFEWFSENGTPDLLISDVLMPEISGPQLYKQLRTMYGDFPVIFVSGYHDVEQVDASRTLNKPFTRADLVEAIKAAL